MIQYEGWWEQNGQGRQPMHNLYLEFQERSPWHINEGRTRFTGSGFDIIDPFLIEHGILVKPSILLPEGSVSFTKVYENHKVYYGGIRTFRESEVWSGDWERVGGGRVVDTGKWEISLKRVRPNIERLPIREIKS